MSTIAADVLDRSPYAAPESDVRIKSDQIEDKYFSSEGRIGVLRFNARTFQGLLMFLGAIFVGAFAYYSEIRLAMIIAAAPCLVAIVAGIVLMVNSAIKRLHDLNLSGWYYLIGIIPLIGSFWVLYYALKPADQGDNNFGSFREATKGDKVMGVIGILGTVIITIAAALPESFYG